MENTIENNRLIAKFMGATVYGNPANKELFIPFWGVYYSDKTGVGNGKVILYHCSWDWLIPVVDKIYDTYEYTTYINNLGQFSEGVWVNTKFIEITYETVVDFIKWYNEQKNN